MTGTGDSPALGRRLWLVTFTDLVSLLLAFFILLFAVSGVREDLWRTATDSLTRSLAPEDAARHVPSADRTVERTIRSTATDLDYLAAVMGETLAREPGLAAVRLARRPGALAVVLPADEADRNAGRAATDPATLTALAGVLRNIDNALAVVVSVDEPATPAAWSEALAFADATAGTLGRSGYPRPIAARARADGSGRGGGVEITLLSSGAGR